MFKLITNYCKKIIKKILKSIIKNQIRIKFNVIKVDV